MVAFGAQGAYICARCQLNRLPGRGVLTASRTSIQGLHTTPRRRFGDEDGQRLPHTTENEDRHHVGKRGGVWYKIIRPNGRIVGRRGRRQRVKAEPLKIKSLDQDSEVMILRDIVEERETEERSRNVENEVPQPSIDLKDVEDSLDERTASKKEDIINAIAAFRPTEEIVDQEAYDQQKKALSNAFTTAQLRLYLRKNTPKPHAVPPSVVADNLMDGTEGPRTPWRYVRSTPWIKRTIKIAPPPASSAWEATKRPQVANSKDFIIDSILRRVWNINLDEDGNARGDLELLLTPVQWKLLQTRSAHKLLTVLRNTKFFNACKLSRIPTRGALRISGPRNEATVMADSIKESFSNTFAVHLDVCWKFPMSNPRTTQENGKSFAENKLREIMQLTKTVIVFDESKQSTDIIGFTESSTEDALRLLASVCASNDRVTSVVHLPVETAARPVPINVHSTLSPIGGNASLQRLQRPELLGGNDLDKVEAAAEHDLDIIAREVAERVTNATTRTTNAMIKTSRISAKVRQSSLWPASQVERTPLLVYFGRLLSPARENDTLDATTTFPNETSGRKVKQSQPATDFGSPKSSVAVSSSFVSRVPNLVRIVSHFSRRSGNETDQTNSAAAAAAVHLTARLVPLIADGSLPIEIHFSVHRLLNQRPLRFGKGASLPPPSPASLDGRYEYRASQDAKMRLDAVTSKIEEHVCDISLPSLAVDLRLQQSVLRKGNIESMLDLPTFKEFVDRIVATYESNTLRAPAFLDIESPPRASKKPPPKQKAGRVVRYVFAGFELRDIRRLRPLAGVVDGVESEDNWEVTDVESGYAGGQKSTFSVHAADNDSELKPFLARCLSMASFIDGAQRGLISAREDPDHKVRALAGGLQPSESTAAPSVPNTSAGPDRAGS